MSEPCAPTVPVPVDTVRAAVRAAVPEGAIGFIGSHYAGGATILERIINLADSTVAINVDDDEKMRRYIAGVMARLQEVWVGRQIAGKDGELLVAVERAPANGFAGQRIADDARQRLAIPPRLAFALLVRCPPALVRPLMRLVDRVELVRRGVQL